MSIEREEVELTFLTPWAAREGMPVDEYRDRSQEQLVELIARARIAIRVEEEAWLRIASEGRLRNLFERQWDEGRWSDADTFEARRIGEALTFDLARRDPELAGVGTRDRCRIARRDPHASSDLAAHPIYGHLVDEGNPHQIGRPIDREFGAIDLVLRASQPPASSRAPTSCSPGGRRGASSSGSQRLSGRCAVDDRPRGLHGVQHLFRPPWSRHAGA